MENERLSRRKVLTVIGASVGLAGCNAPDSPATNAQPELINNTPQSESVYTDVYRATIDSVVRIQVGDSDGRGGQGSGFVYDEDHVVTNQHVVTDSDTVQVRFSDGTWQTGDVVGTDVYSDLAVVEVDEMPGPTTPLTLIEGEVAVGQRVVAIGNPFGLSGSVSAGIVSGVDRTLPAANNFTIPDAIQTDAAVNPGNSGGPIVTLDGRVAGVINAGSRGGDNIGFAISAALMRRVIPSLIQTGEYDHSYMGVQLLDVTPRVAEANNLPNARGVYIDTALDGEPSDGVLEGSTGETRIEGVRIPTGGDVVVEMGGEPIPARQTLSTYLALATSPGDTISVEVIRDGSRTTVDLTLGSRPDPDSAPTQPTDDP